jgi:alpha-tubulin suppressor-like RCC1 family protein
MIHPCIITRRPGAALGAALVVGALGCREDAGSPTSPELGPALEIESSVALSFRQVSAGGSFSCGVTTGSRAYCWGDGAFGQLGADTVTQSLTPVAVTGGLSFRQVSAGIEHACGVTTDDKAYCWGLNNYGELGDGTEQEPRLAPVAVVGGLRFRQVSVASGGDGAHTCGVTTDDRAYCWGNNLDGQLGNPTISFNSLTPVAVAGGLRFRQVSTGGILGGSPVLGGGRGEAHTCGVTTDDRAFCWGVGRFGQLGAGTTLFSDIPVAVLRGLRFRQVSAGGRHTCGVTTSDLAYCWGSDILGQLGNTASGPELCEVSIPCSTRPVAVSGDRKFLRVSAGEAHSCALNPFERVFCWGANFRGQLGDGTLIHRPTPVRVLGGLLWRQVSASKGRHTCGVTIDNLAYCWGKNDNGELGDGTINNRRKPTPVAGVT